MDWSMPLLFFIDVRFLLQIYLRALHYVVSLKNLFFR